MSTRGSVIVTCGPSYEPIDEVRRLTNHSTGELGLLLASALAADGWEVTCLAGTGATWCGQLHPAVSRCAFTTNEDLAAQLTALAAGRNYVAFFHTAALCDFRVRAATAADGTTLHSPKIPSRDGIITLTLEPAVKVLRQLRPLFPKARLVGWKYELAGQRPDVIAKGQRQLRENASDLCILNGAAWGPGFGILGPDDSLTPVPDKPTLCIWLTQWLTRHS